MQRRAKRLLAHWFMCKMETLKCLSCCTPSNARLACFLHFFFARFLLKICKTSIFQERIVVLLSQMSFRVIRVRRKSIRRE